MTGQTGGAGQESFADVAREYFTTTFPEADERWIAAQVVEVIAAAAAHGRRRPLVPATAVGGGIPGDIFTGLMEDLLDRQSRVPLETLQEQARVRPAAKPVEAALRDGQTVKVIAEVKRSSPSMGALAAIEDPAGLATDYEAGGARLISVHVERRRFGGSLDDLAAVRAAVDVPVLHRDFVISSYQVWEARAHGADAVVLIAAALEQEALVSLVERVYSLGMTPLVEVHYEEEVDRAVDAGARVLGVNARDLRTYEVDRDTFGRLAPLIPQGCVRIATSGVRGPHDAVTYAQQGAHAVVVGESLVTGRNSRAAVADVVAALQHPGPRAAWRT